ncbi:hypothetical protein TVAG_407570 [Trichomonas vaginalis G3]|uniref:DUF3447 domain-containing protein n=1 Tax=Trichomonas vaginalis (strain ATCC PRA-98 / G3) TaxID=412133 RepID=A2F199_TRIV3|nr:protein ubiquitination [Trichomonas vaginalis G3]EAY01328.1 hypothetical protein TVAG_407570 [Trichomonas vaginalis G3]KAI5506813.1 protein ubiquitination [Trichomonas vaginalis G3]|eukprot:XP_001330186.1 hypothetical protein [Trichomonas vaginalis G3]
MLLEAMKQGSQKIFEFLFKKGAKIHFQMNQNTILRSKLDIFKLYCSALAKSDLDKFLIEKINEIEPQKAKILLELGANANTTMICKMNKSNNTYEESLLILSIKRKCFELVDYLINNGANINDKINNKKSLIIYALESQSYKIIQYLLDLGVDINGKDQFGKESLLYALNTGTDEIMTMLIRHGLDIKGIHENQVLREKMITRFSESTLEVLLDKYPGYFNEPKHGHPMLYYAVINHSYEKVRVILDHDFKMNNHLSIFIDAYKTGDIEIFILLLQSYKELDFKKKSDENIINMALKLQSNETLDILVEKGYLNCINIEQLYTKFMIEFNKNEYLKHFIHVLKSKNINLDFKSSSPMLIACKYQRYKVLEPLIDSNYFKEKDLFESLQYLFKCKSQVTTKIEIKIIQNIPNGDFSINGIPALTYAIQIGKLKVAELLLEKGCIIKSDNINTKMIQTALFSSIKFNSVELAKYLMSFMDQVPIDLFAEAINQKSFPIVKVLLDSGKINNIKNRSMLIENIINALNEQMYIYGYRNISEFWIKLIVELIDKEFACKYQTILNFAIKTMSNDIISALISKRQIYQINLKELYEQVMKGNQNNFYFDSRDKFLYQFNETLIGLGIDMNELSALSFAYGNPDLMKLLLDNSKFDQESIQSSVIKLLNDHNPNEFVLMELFDKLQSMDNLVINGMPLLIFVIQKFSIKLTRFLISKGINVMTCYQ